MDTNKAHRDPKETEGGFNPDRPVKAEKTQVGPMPTDDPNNKVKKPKVDPALKTTSKEKSEDRSVDSFPEEGAVSQRRSDKEKPGL